MADVDTEKVDTRETFTCIREKKRDRKGEEEGKEGEKERHARE